MENMLYAHMYALFSTASVLNFLYHVNNKFDVFRTQSFMKDM